LLPGSFVCSVVEILLFGVLFKLTDVAVNAAARQLDKVLRQKVFQHSGHDLSSRANMFLHYLMCDLRYSGAVDSAFFQQKNRKQLSKLFHMICSISHMTSENRGTP
jgi:hypothetical protein